MDRANCDKRLTGEETKVKTTSWTSVELLADAHKRTVNWMGAFIVLLILALVGVIVYHNWKWSEYDTYEIAQDGEGNNVVGDYNRSYYNEPAGAYSEETVEN